MIGGSSLIPAAVAVGSIAGQALDRLTQGPDFRSLLDKSPEARHQSSVDSNPGRGEPRVDSHSEANRLQTIRQNVARLEQQLKETLGTLLQADPSIDASEPIVLGLHDSGRILEMSGHQDRAVIEQLLENNSPLSNQVRQLLEQAEHLRLDDPGLSSASRPRLMIDPAEGRFAVA